MANNRAQYHQLSGNANKNNEISPVRIDIIKKNTNNKPWWGCGKKATWEHCCRNVNWCSHFGKQYSGSSKIKNKTSNSTPGYIFEENKNTNSKRCKHPPRVHSGIVYSSRDMEATSVSIKSGMNKDYAVYMQGFPGGASCKEPACQYRNHKRRGFDPWVRKIPWKRAWQLTPVFMPEESSGQRSLWALVHRVAKSQTQLTSLSTHTQHIYTTHNTNTPWNTAQPQKMIKLCHLQQDKWPQRALCLVKQVRQRYWMISLTGRL